MNAAPKLPGEVQDVQDASTIVREVPTPRGRRRGRPGDQMQLSVFEELDREEARRAGGADPLSSSQLVRALGRRWSSGHARAAVAEELEHALDRFQAHAREMFGDGQGTALVFQLMARGEMSPPDWLTDLFREHVDSLRELFEGSGRRDPDADLPDLDPYGQSDDGDR